MITQPINLAIEINSLDRFASEALINALNSGVSYHGAKIGAQNYFKKRSPY
jgi:hypothetical protein